MRVFKYILMHSKTTEILWPRSWVRRGLVFLGIELILKIGAELTRPDFVIIDLAPALTIGATHYRNPHSCLGMLRSFSPLLKIILTAACTVLLLIVVAYFHFVRSGPTVRLASAVLMVGAAGNLADRITIGAVVDYVYIQLGPDGDWLYLAWNLSDVVINAGIAILLYAAWIGETPFDDGRAVTDKRAD